MDALEPRRLLSAVPTTGEIFSGIESKTGELFGENPVNGASEFSTGTTFVAPRGVAEDSSQNVYTVDAKGGSDKKGAIDITASDGDTTVLSDNSTADGSLLVHPYGIVVGTNGTLYVTDPKAGTGHHGAIIAVDPSTGIQTIFSEQNSTYGKQLHDPEGIAVDSSGNLLVTDGGSNGEVLSINATTGVQTVISRNAPQDHYFIEGNPDGIAVAPDGTIYVTNEYGSNNNDGSVIAINPSTGKQTIAGRGEDLFHPTNICYDAATGFFYIAEPKFHAGHGGVIEFTAEGGQSPTFPFSTQDHPYAVIPAQP